MAYEPSADQLAQLNTNRDVYGQAHYTRPSTGAAMTAFFAADAPHAYGGHRLDSAILARRLSGNRLPMEPPD